MTGSGTISLLVALCLLFVAPIESQKEAELNRVFDQMMDTFLAKHGHDFDPIKFPLKRIGLSRDYGFIKQNIFEAKLDNVTMAGLSTMRRTGDASVVKLGNNTTVIKAKLAFGVVNYFATTEISVLGFGPARSLSGRVSRLDIDFEIVADSKTGQSTLIMFKLNNLDGLTLKVDGPGIILDLVYNKILHYTVGLFKFIIKYIVEVMMRIDMAVLVKDSEIIHRFLN